MRCANNFIGAGVAAVLLASCGGSDSGRRPGGDRPAARAVSDLPVKIGPPYRVRGVTYAPSDDHDYDAVGLASWYGHELRGNLTARGEPFVPEGITAAHTTLPLPSYVEVTALDTGRTILVRINDRGPFSGDRIIDLSAGAARLLGVMGRGSSAVRVRRVEPPESDRARLRAHLPASERPPASHGALDALRRRMGGGWQGGEAPAPDAIPAPGRAGYVVQVAAFSSKGRAHDLAGHVGGNVVKGDGVWRVRLGPYADLASARTGVDRAASRGYADARIMANDGS